MKGGRYAVYRLRQNVFLAHRRTTIPMLSYVNSELTAEEAETDNQARQIQIVRHGVLNRVLRAFQNAKPNDCF